MKTLVKQMTEHEARCDWLDKMEQRERALYCLAEADDFYGTVTFQTLLAVQQEVDYTQDHLVC